MSKESRYTVWHQRDDDGLVRAVFASPDELLFAHMMRHAHYLVSLVNDDVTASVEDSDEGVVYVKYQNKAGEKGQDALVVGAPDQAFEEILMTQRDRIATAGVKDHFGSWSAVPDQFMVDFDTK